MKRITKTVLLTASLFFPLWSLSGCTNATSSSVTESLCEHVYDEGKVSKEPTCTEEGVKTYTCKLCGASKTETIPALGHLFPETGAVGTPASCTEAGVMNYECERCHAIVSEAIPATGHHYDQGVVTVPAGCLTTGVMTYTCTVCGTSYTETIPATGHADNDGDGYCDACGTFTGRQSVSSEATPLVDGPWVNPEGISWWSYGLEKAPSEETTVIQPSTEQEHTAGSKAVKIDFNSSSKCLASSPSGEYVLHLGVKDLQKNANWTVEYYAYASADFTGNLNKMLCNQNFGNENTCKNVSYESNYATADLAGKGWVKVTATFDANETSDYGNICAFRIAFSVGTEGWKGTLYLADFTVTLTNYIRTQAGLPSLDEPTKPVNTVPVLDTLSANHAALPDTIDSGAVWTAGPLYFGQGLFSIDKTIEYAKGAKSLLINLNKATSIGQESGVILAFKNLSEGQKYTLSFWAQGSKTYNGCLSGIMGNPNYTFVTAEGEVKTMLDLTAEASEILTEGAMLAHDWVKVSLAFTAHPKAGLCSLRMQLRQQAGWKGQLWLSYFEAVAA